MEITVLKKSNVREKIDSDFILEGINKFVESSKFPKSLLVYKMEDIISKLEESNKKFDKMQNKAIKNLQIFISKNDILNNKCENKIKKLRNNL